MEIKELICIECPRGCQLTATLDGGKVIDVKGNFCIKGKTYAESELTMPLRVLTSTVKLKGGGMLPVKTSGGVLKDRQFEVMERLKKIEVCPPVDIGQVIAVGIDGEVSLISTKKID